MLAVSLKYGKKAYIIPPTRSKIPTLQKKKLQLSSVLKVFLGKDVAML